MKAVLLQMSWEWSTVQETVQKKKIWTTVAFGVQVPQTKVMTMNPVQTVFHKIDTNIEIFANGANVDNLKLIFSTKLKLTLQYYCRWLRFYFVTDCFW